jgi:cytosine/adenosine deaminase-related metal-dependent hydrolase
MILHNIRISGRQGLQQLRIINGRIAAITDPVPPPPETATIPMPGALAFPGLVNSHDHLDFNNFPQLANRIYTDYTEWGKDIHEHNGDRIHPVLKIPSPLRTKWGLYKNLLNGFTTVVHHGVKLDIGKEELITVVQDCHCLHSISGEPYWKWKLNRLPAPSRPTAVHIGEGTSPRAKKEIGHLHRWNLLKRDIIGIHGITLEEEQAAAFRALVWCPDSNYFLYDQTADIRRLKNRLPILFGTDSTLSSRWNMREQLRMARKKGLLSDAELLDALTITPAKIWRLPFSGQLKEGQPADLVVVRADAMASEMDAFYQADPKDILLILHRGEIRLFDISLAEKLKSLGLVRRRFSLISFQDHLKYVQGDLPGLMSDIRDFYPGVEFPAGLTPIEN